jgi:single-stranded DNA-binding protein
MGTKGTDMNLNGVEPIDFLGGEPETTYTPSGKAVTTLSIATKTSWMKRDERQART